MGSVNTKRLLVLVAVPVIVTGCVSVENPRNWQPQDSSTDSAYYDCLREAQQGVASASFGASRGGAYGSARSSAKTNDDLLCACMASKGFSLRKPTTTETVLGVAFSPVWVPLGAVAAIGEGITGDPPKR